MPYRHFPQMRLFVVLCACLGLFTLGQTASAKVGQVSTWLGKLYTGDGGNANSASLDMPRGFVSDTTCSLYIADTQNHVIRRIDGSSNIITTFAGTGQYGLTNGANLRSTFRLPSDVTFGPNGELYVADSDGATLRRIANERVTDWSGGLHKPTGIVSDGTTLYISDTGANRILSSSTLSKNTSLVTSGITAPGKLLVNGTTLYVLYNNGNAFGMVNLGSGTFTPIKTDFKNADGMTMHNGLIYIVSGLHGVYNEIVTFNPSANVFTTIKSVFETEWYNHASDITFCGSDMRLLFSGGSSVFQAKGDGSGESKLAGEHRWNDTDGPRSTARVGRPYLMTLSPDKLTMYLFTNQHLKKINLKTNVLSTMAGGQADNYVNGPADIARVSGPMQMVTSPKGTAIYIADRNNNRIRVFNRKTNSMSTLTGAGEVNAFNGTKNAYAEGLPCATTTRSVAGCAYFDRPSGLAISRDGQTLYVADSDNNRIRTVNVTTGKTALLAGTGKAGMKNGAAKQAQFKKPTSLLLSMDGRTLYIVEQGNNAIRTLNLANKQVATLVGNGKAGYLDGKLSQGRLSLPNYLAQGSNNILYLSEGGSLRIRTINLAKKTISTLAGSGKRGSQNGVPGLASFANPRQLVMLNSSTLLVADDANDMIRAISLR